MALYWMGFGGNVAGTVVFALKWGVQPCPTTHSISNYHPTMRGHGRQNEEIHYTRGSAWYLYLRGKGLLMLTS